MNEKTKTFIYTPMVEWTQTDSKETFMEHLVDCLKEGTMECTPAEMIVVNEPIVMSSDFLKEMAADTDPNSFYMEDLDHLFPGQELDWSIIKKLFHEEMVEKTKEYEEECFDLLAREEREENESFKEYKRRWDLTKEGEEPSNFKVYFDSEMLRLRTKINREQKRINYLESLL
jgi:hypothetical protein